MQPPTLPHGFDKELREIGDFENWIKAGA